MRLRRFALVALALFACRSKGATDSPDAGASIVARTDKYGVTLRATGVPGTVYTVGSDKFEWNGDTVAAAYELGIPTKDLPAGGTISVTARWYDDANVPREQVIRVPFTRPEPLSMPTTLAATATSLPAFAGFGAPGATSRPAYTVALAPGCTVLLDGNEAYHFDLGAKWVRSSRDWEAPYDVTLPLDRDEAVVKAGRFPDVLHPDETHVVRLECPGLGPQETTLGVDPFGRAWTVHGIFHASLPTTHPAGSRKTLVVVHGSKFLDGLRRGEDIARFYGPSVPVMDVDLVGKIIERDSTSTQTCPGRTLELRSFEISVDDRHGGFVARTTIEPKLDCAKLDGPNVSSILGADGGTTLVVRPDDAKVDAWARTILR